MDTTLDRILSESILRCMKCGNEIKLTPREGKGYIRCGWPTCCGETMRLLTKRELEEERDATTI